MYDPVLDAATRLRDCVCIALTNAGRPVCRCSLEPGTRATADFCGGKCGGADGTATITVLRVIPVRGQSPCSSVRRQVTMEITVWRCIPTMCSDGSPPNAADLDGAEAGILLDRFILENVVTCCFDQDCNASYGGWQAQLSQGGCGGGTTTVTVEIADCGCGQPIVPD